MRATASFPLQKKSDSFANRWESAMRGPTFRTLVQSTPLDLEPAHIWQGAVFARFLRGKAVHRVFVEPNVVVEWGAGRFGVARNRKGLAAIGVRKFLEYSCTCGFLENACSSGGAAYQVVFDQLTSPPKRIPRLID
jgi:hypothetical protein